MKKRDPEIGFNWGTICTLVEMIAADGRKRKVQAANVEGILRIIQSIPSPKAEPFKRWLAKTGRKVSTSTNFKALPEKEIRKRLNE